MPFIPAINCLKVVMKFTYSNQAVINDFWFKYSGLPGTTEREDLADAMHTFWTSHYKTLLSSGIALNEIDVIDWTTQNGPVSQLVIAPSEQGTDGSSPMVLNAALCVSLRTASRGRNYRGRIYTPGMATTHQTSPGTFETAWVGNVITQVGWLLNAANTAAGIWSVVSFFLNKAPRAQGVATPITAVTADDLIDSQRRRLIGRGQ